MINLDQDPLIEIIVLLQSARSDLKKITDLVYHLNKSLGVSFIQIREELIKLPSQKRSIAYRNFLQVIDNLNSPHLFLNPDE